MLPNCYVSTLIEGIVVFITHTLPRKGKTVIAAQVEPIMGGASDQSWRLVDQQRAAALDLKLLMEMASDPQSFVEEKQLPLTSKEWVSECCPESGEADKAPDTKHH